MGRGTELFFESSTLAFLQDSFEAPRGIVTIDIKLVNVTGQELANNQTTFGKERSNTTYDLVVSFDVTGSLFPGDSRNYNFSGAISEFFSNESHVIQLRQTLIRQSPFFGDYVVGLPTNITADKTVQSKTNKNVVLVVTSIVGVVISLSGFCTVFSLLRKAGSKSVKEDVNKSQGHIEGPAYTTSGEDSSSVDILCTSSEEMGGRDSQDSHHQLRAYSSESADSALTEGVNWTTHAGRQNEPYLIRFESNIEVPLTPRSEWTPRDDNSSQRDLPVSYLRLFRAPQESS